MDYDDIRYQVEDANAIIAIDRPKRLNAFRGRTVEELIDVQESIELLERAIRDLSSLPTKFERAGSSATLGCRGQAAGVVPAPGPLVVPCRGPLVVPCGPEPKPSLWRYAVDKPIF